MTRAESEFQDRVRRLGCIVCILDLGVDSCAEIHHILRGGRRIGEMDILPLCPDHHRNGLRKDWIVSRHPWKTEFIKRYGSEVSLLAKTQELLA